MNDPIKSRLLELAANFKDELGGVIPLLHQVQKQFGYIPKSCAETVAPLFRLSTAEVEGVISFYHQFKREPQGKHRIQICRAEACQANGCRELEAFSKEYLQLEYGQTSADGLLSLDSVYCLGLCSHGPAVRVDDDLFVEVGTEKLQSIVEGLNDGR
ncbi:MAG: NAD(P)H-dependent oxidoreductase subunit E [Cellvibrionaceae bacterium]|nr:NAD(P)H-dependent oxidoreductase subunit E [Cellvibrionaceae bacterium]